MREIRLNNKGFSLIELLATIIILGILGAVGSVSYINYLEKSQEKAKEAFVKQLENSVEDYISMYGTSELIFNNNGTKEKCYIEVNGPDNNVEVCDEVNYYSASNNPEFGTIVTYVSDKDFVNPVTKIPCTDDNLNIEIYRDSDYVYCFKVKPNGTESCIDKPAVGDYAIDTCKNLYKEEELDEENN